MNAVSLAALNEMGREDFVGVCGGFFEHSPWVAERAWERRPFASREEMHGRMVMVVSEASMEEKLALIRAHPDLVGRLAAEGKLTRESTAEQRAAGLSELSAEEVTTFERYNAAYRAKFGFPFVICARENKKEAILAAFPVRLQHGNEQELYGSLAEIGNIGWHRLLDRVSE